MTQSNDIYITVNSNHHENITGSNMEEYCNFELSLFVTQWLVGRFSNLPTHNRMIYSLDNNG